MSIKKSAFFIFLLVFLFNRAVFAAPRVDPNAFTKQGGAVCAPDKFSILKFLEAIPTSLMSTAVVHSLGVLGSENLFLIVFGTTASEAMGCLNYISNNALNDVDIAGGFVSAMNSLTCPDTDSAICQSITNQFHIGGGQELTNYDSMGFANSRVAGSLLGYTYLAENTLRYEPPPVNMAFFFNDYLAKIPVIGERAYAQQQGDYGHPLINAVLGIWKIFRNLAYALMSLVMLWTGFAIITRRKISAQTVVTVQYALPKIVIALVMIALSYPIGALITSLAWSLFWNAPLIILSLSGGALDSFAQVYNAMLNMGWGGMVTLVIAVSVLFAGAGSLVGLLGLLAIVLLVFALFAYIKALWVYIKMVISVATSPLQIALYALPGNDDKLEHWLKQMSAWAVGLFGIAMVMNLTVTFALTLILQSIGGAINAGGSGQPLINVVQPIVAGSLLNVFVVPVLLLFGFATAIKMPNMAEEAIVGKPTRR